MSVDVMDLPEELGLARPEPDRLRRIAAAAVKADPNSVQSVADVEVSRVDYLIGTPMTHALLRCRGSAVVDGASTRWSAFVKVLQSPWEWEHIDMIPAEFRADFADNVPWRLELDAFTSEIADVLPCGLRRPHLYDIVEIDEHHAAMWVEDVEQSDAPWDVARFARAAELLGRLAGRRPIGTPAVLAPSPKAAIPGFTLRYYVGGRVRMGALPGLAHEAMWMHPTVRAAVDATGEQGLRGDLLEAGTHLDGWLDRLDALPQTYCHGDASPQNLLVPRLEPETFVVIDWGFNSPLAVGFDLGQLLLGLAHASELDVETLPAVVEAIVPAYAQGMAAEGFPATAADVWTGFVLSLAVRSMFTALPLENLDASSSSAQADYWVERIKLTRFMLDLVASHQSSR